MSLTFPQNTLSLLMDTISLAVRYPLLFLPDPLTILPDALAYCQVSSIEFSKTVRGGPAVQFFQKKVCGHAKLMRLAKYLQFGRLAGAEPVASGLSKRIHAFLYQESQSSETTEAESIFPYRSGMCQCGLVWARSFCGPG